MENKGLVFKAYKNRYDIKTIRIKDDIIQGSFGGTWLDFAHTGDITTHVERNGNFSVRDCGQLVYTFYRPAIAKRVYNQ